MNKEYEFLKTMLSFSISGVLHIFKVFPIQRNKILLYGNADLIAFSHPQICE